MVNKFGRNYKLIVEGIDGNTIIIEPPFTIEFDIQRKNFFGTNIASFRVMNLAKNTRSQIVKNQTDPGLFRKVSFLGGYGKNLSVMFVGQIREASSERNGTNFITSIEAQDGGYAFGNAQVSKVFSSGTTNRSVIFDLINSMKNLGVNAGAIGVINGAIQRGASFSGSTVQILNEITNGAFFVDNGLANVLSDNESIAGDIIVIEPSSGLLGTPRREQSFLTFDVLFEPKLQVGKKCRIKSTTGEQFNGDYRIDSIHHKGTISEAIAGTAITTVGLIYGKAFAAIRQEFSK